MALGRRPWALLDPLEGDAVDVAELAAESVYERLMGGPVCYEDKRARRACLRPVGWRQASEQDERRPNRTLHGTGDEIHLTHFGPFTALTSSSAQSSSGARGKRVIRPKTSFLLVSYVAISAAGLACGGEDAVAGGADASGGGVDAQVPDRPAGDAAVPDGSREAYCQGQGPAIRVPGGAAEGDRCLGSIVGGLFRYAICTCEDVESTTSSFTTDSFDSDTGGERSSSGGPVGVNQVFNHTGALAIGGSLTVAGSAELELTGNDVRIGGDLRTAGPLGFTGSTVVARDAWIGGDIDGAGSLAIARDLHVPEGAATARGVNVAGQIVREPVSVSTPCDCAPENILDIAAIVEAARSNNHNADVDLDPDLYSSLIGDNEIELPCGRFFLGGIGGTGNLRIRVQGRTALFIAGDVETTGELMVELGPEGELDVFIAGNLDATGAVSFGSPDRPAASRVYVSGTDGINLTTSSGVFVGNIYAPRAPVESTGSTQVFGAVFARRLDATGELTVHYDRAIINAGEDCDTPPPTTCDGCGECMGGIACSEAGMCLPECTTDGDCCEPFTCIPETGSCEPILI